MNNNEYRVGVNRGLPVGMGYFSVSFGFGAMAVSQGLKTLDAVLISAGKFPRKKTPSVCCATAYCRKKPFSGRCRRGGFA